MGSNRRIQCAVSCFLLGGIPGLVRAQCEFDWDAGYCPPGTNGAVYASVVWDDGTGPALYVAGEFLSAGGVSAARVAKWNGTSWSALGSGVNNTVYALAVFNDGSGSALYAGGLFTAAGGATANRIAKWNGTSWSPLIMGAVNGVNNTVFALGTYGSQLCAGGAFTAAGGVTAANRFAAWSGTAWSAVGTGSGTDYPVYAILEWGGILYIGGGFTKAGGVTAYFVARWNGSTWSPVGTATGFNSSVYALALFDSGGGPVLYAGGDFTTAGGVAANRVAKWNGTAWSALGTGMAGGTIPTVRALKVHNDGTGSALYVGGDFTSAGGTTAYSIAKWSGTAWSAMGSGMSIYGGGQTVWTLQSYDDGGGSGLYATGYFTYSGGGLVNYVSRWRGGTWSGLGKGANSDVMALESFDDGGGPALYAGGLFEHAGGVYAPRVGKLKPTGWSRVGTIVPSEVRTLAVLNYGGGPALFAGGYINISSQNCVCRWDGTTWTSSACGMNNSVFALSLFDSGSGPALHVGGWFTTIGTTPFAYIAKWDGSTWSGLNGGMNNTVYALEATDIGGNPVLYAAGGFSTAGGVSAIGTAEWNGSAWSALDNTGGFAARDLLVFDDDGAGPNAPALYAARGSSVSRWNPGSPGSWTALGGGMNGAVYALTVFDDGSGPAIYAGGYFTIAGGYAATRIAKWDGTRWWPLGSGVAGGIDSVYALAGFDDGSGPALYVGGSFTSAGGKPSAYIAKWASRQSKPDVVQSPVAQTKSVSETATFSVTASGSELLSYQWRRDGAPLSDDDRISGATSATLMINPVGVSDTGSYDVVVTNACGSDTSDPATLTVNCTPVLPSDLDLDCDVDADDLVAFELCAFGSAVPRPVECADRDVDHDDDVDLDDFGAFQRCQSGKNIPPDPNCAD